MTETASRSGLISALEAIAEQAPDEGLSLGEFVDQLGERAFGIILFAMALPISIPFLYGVPQVMALPMMALSAQMALGRDEPWLPTKFKQRNLSKDGLTGMARGGRKWFGWLEALARPRLTWLSGPTAERLVGAIFILFCASILVPLPATNTTPGTTTTVDTTAGTMDTGTTTATGPDTTADTSDCMQQVAVPIQDRQAISATPVRLLQSFSYY